MTTPKKPAGAVKNSELESLVLSIAEMLAGAEGVEGRRGFIMGLQGRGLPGAQVEALTLKAFPKLGKKGFEEDLLWIQDYWDSYLGDLGSDQQRREVLAYNTELRKRAIDQGDLATAQRANQHRAKLLKLG